MGDMVTITKKEYDALKRTEFELACLEAGGVDNWEYYSDALREGGFFDDEDEDEDE